LSVCFYGSPCTPGSFLPREILPCNDPIRGRRVRLGKPSLLRSVGLEPQPPHEVTGAVYTGDTVWHYETTLVQNLSPLLVAHGIATEEETDINAFAERVRFDLGPDPVLISGPHLAVWASKPSQHLDDFSSGG
jgi:hypothetical protein